MLNRFQICLESQHKCISKNQVGERILFWKHSREQKDDKNEWNRFGTRYYLGENLFRVYLDFYHLRKLAPWQISANSAFFLTFLEQAYFKASGTDAITDTLDLIILLIPLFTKFFRPIKNHFCIEVKWFCYKLLCFYNWLLQKWHFKS